MQYENVLDSLNDSGSIDASTLDTFLPNTTEMDLIIALKRINELERVVTELMARQNKINEKADFEIRDINKKMLRLIDDVNDNTGFIRSDFNKLINHQVILKRHITLY
jgi:hypothetical protein